jgi:DNA-directed RNA polymerase subunit K
MEDRKYSKYEKARLMGARSLQIANGAIPLIKTDLKDPMDIAMLELENNLCPIDIRNLKEITN